MAYAPRSTKGKDMLFDGGQACKAPKYGNYVVHQNTGFTEYKWSKLYRQDIDIS